MKTNHEKTRPLARAAVPRDVEPRLLQLASDGRLPIPQEIRAAMEIGPSGRVLASVEAGELRLVSQAVSIRRTQAQLRRRRGTGESVVAQFLAERRELWGET